ncbi:phage/plasmid replication protein, II/X family [Vibrio parahaemolyticus]|uniref:phage/plasmid replication protein, II/X family n=1 Tax=Vibrio parahaemolyticus TaxID=670 RepID=UPI0021128245|nr:phage/plasmid replication protein, II/X family [Vibrio parahaemolyticus]MCQ6456608.1 phage/plasmid replication protein, II/X family [Vibrio parahaemolyticus]MCQ6461266.1 phage/plasmid replication protein, II/X family [Vibrio parahaemolyticus]MCQ6466533.1 phage/plasmid replication protein, II/X family [Vibrio parahaemolyticus]MCQ6471587.1 phage/plasmid replication protein, II/X family [Vibrio parahaemolyticus]
MIDKLKISIPFKTEFTHTTHQEKSGEAVSYVDIKECSRRGIGLEAKTIFFTGEVGAAQYEVADLRHPFESLPTHFTGMAFKIYQGTKYRSPCIELKASPAKILQGHNVYGPTSIEVGAIEMLMAFYNSYPDVYEMLDVPSTTLDAVDATYSARVKTELQARQVIQQLKNVSNKQMRTAVRNEHETTVYFNKNSRHCDRKAYLKGPEFNRQLRDLRSQQEKGNRSYDRVIDVMSDPKLINYARHLVRFEAGAHRRYLDAMGIPKNLFDAISYQKEYESTGNNLIADIWTKAFTPLLEALEGQHMNIFNDEEVHQKLKLTYFRYTPKGNISYAKADKLFRFYRSLISDGYKAVYQSFTSRQTFARHLNDLLAIGFSKAQLQNLQGNGNDNVVPLLQVIDIDFSQQHPADYVEPMAGHISQMYGYGCDNVVRLSA